MLHEPHTLDEPLLTARELSVLLGDIPSKTILQYAREGRLPCVRVGRHVRFVKSDVERALDAQRQSRVIERTGGARAAAPTGAAARVRRLQRGA
jgi:excisionase family DNA binding protein